MGIYWVCGYEARKASSRKEQVSVVAHHKVISAAVATLTFGALAPQVVSLRLKKNSIEMSEKPRVLLVTGAAGYVGSHCVTEFLNAGFRCLFIVRPNFYIKSLCPLNIVLL